MGGAGPAWRDLAGLSQCDSRSLQSPCERPRRGQRLPGPALPARWSRLILGMQPSAAFGRESLPELKGAGMLAPALTTGTKLGAGQGTRVGGWGVCTNMTVNPIKSHDVQQPMPLVRAVSLHSNQVTHIQPSPTSGMDHLSHVTITDNPRARSKSHHLTHATNTHVLCIPPYGRPQTQAFVISHI